MSRRKYTFEQRLEVVMHYLATDDVTNGAKLIHPSG